MNEETARFIEDCWSRDLPLDQTLVLLAEYGHVVKPADVEALMLKLSADFDDWCTSYDQR